MGVNLILSLKVVYEMEMFGVFYYNGNFLLNFVTISLKWEPSYMISSQISHHQNEIGIFYI